MKSETMVAVIDTAAVKQTQEESTLNEVVTAIESQASAISIKTEEDYQDAVDFGRMLKQRTAEVKNFWKPMKDAAHKAHAEICSKEKAMLQPLTNAEKILKKSVSGYLAEQERKRKEIEDAARRAAHEEAERRVAEAIAFEESGNIEAAETALDEAGIIDNAASAIAVGTKRPKVKGSCSRKDWKITAIDVSKVPVNVNGVEIRPVDMGAVMRLIRASKGRIQIPGITYEEMMQISFRR